MKKTLVLAALSLTLITSGASAAGWTIGLGGGLGIPTGDFADFWGSGFLANGHADYWVNDRCAIGANVGWMLNNPSDDYDALLQPVGGDDSFTFLNFGAHARYMFPVGEGKVHPYVMVGTGIYNLKEDYSQTNPAAEAEYSQTAFGFNGGLGIGYAVSPTVSIAAEGNYHHVITDENEIGHDSAPFFGVTGGVVFAVGGKK